MLVRAARIPSGSLRVVDGGVVGKGQLGGQLMGAGTVEADPAVLPGVLLIGRIADELAGACAKNRSPGADLQRSRPPTSNTPRPETHQVDEVMVADARPPGLGRGAALQYHS